MTQDLRSPRTRSWRVALSLFTVIPAGAPAELDETAAVRAVYWLPAVGLLLGVVAAGLMVCVEASGAGGPRRLLGGVLAVAVLALLTGGLHLDGLADTADGLGSRRPAAEALAIMRRPDTGPLGVATLLLVVLIQVTALGTVPRGLDGAGALVLAVVTGRVAVLLATGGPAARPGGLGALVAGRTSARARRAGLAALVVAAAGTGFGLGGVGLGGVVLAGRWLLATAAGLLAAGLLRRTARRRLGGMTGDVFGATIELTTAIVLLVVALS